MPIDKLGGPIAEDINVRPGNTRRTKEGEMVETGFYHGNEFYRFNDGERLNLIPNPRTIQLKDNSTIPVEEWIKQHKN